VEALRREPFESLREVELKKVRDGEAAASTRAGVRSPELAGGLCSPDLIADYTTWEISSHYECSC